MSKKFYKTKIFPLPLTIVLAWPLTLWPPPPILDKLNLGWSDRMVQFGFCNVRQQLWYPWHEVLKNNGSTPPEVVTAEEANSMNKKSLFKWFNVNFLFVQKGFLFRGLVKSFRKMKRPSAFVFILTYSQTFLHMLICI